MFASSAIIVLKWLGIVEICKRQPMLGARLLHITCILHAIWDSLFTRSLVYVFVPSFDSDYIQSPSPVGMLRSEREMHQNSCKGTSTLMLTLSISCSQKSI